MLIEYIDKAMSMAAYDRLGESIGPPFFYTSMKQG